MMFRQAVLLAAALALVACPAESPPDSPGLDAGSPVADAGPADPLVVSTTAGQVQGESDDGLRVFKGIPYAAPPLGDLRFRPPQAHEPWDGVRDARDFSSPCPQPPAASGAAVDWDEDCLGLNVWAHDDEEVRPVMVWIHGGAFTQGATDFGLYDQQHVARDGDVVVVSLNYRLGALGFLAAEALADENDDNIAGNYGIQDQIAALQWVQDNIAAFGGDPNEVTVFGESAGGMSICMLLAAPSAEDLFHRGIIQSGGGCWAYPQLRDATEAQGGIEAWEPLLSTLGCDQGDVAACLRDKPVTALVNAVTNTVGFNVRPVVDGKLIIGQAYDLLAQGRVADKALLVGANANESTFWQVGQQVTPESLEAMFQRWFPNQAAQLTQMYPANNDIEAWWAQAQFWSDFYFICPMFAFAKVSSGGDQPTYAYFFNHAVSTPPLSYMGASHSYELFYLFKAHDKLGEYSFTPSASGVRIGDDMRNAWSDFAYGLPPSPPQDWPTYTAGEASIASFATAATTLESDVVGQRCVQLRGLFLGR